MSINPLLPRLRGTLRGAILTGGRPHRAVSLATLPSLRGSVRATSATVTVTAIAPVVVAAGERDAKTFAHFPPTALQTASRVPTASDREPLASPGRKRGMSDAWFEGLDPGDVETGADRILGGGAEAPDEWPARAIESGFADDEADYYDLLHEATIASTRAAVREAERAGDRQLVHAVHAMDDMGR